MKAGTLPKPESRAVAPGWRSSERRPTAWCRRRTTARRPPTVLRPKRSASRPAGIMPMAMPSAEDAARMPICRQHQMPHRLHAGDDDRQPADIQCLHHQRAAARMTTSQLRGWSEAMHRAARLTARISVCMAFYSSLNRCPYRHVLPAGPVDPSALGRQSVSVTGHCAAPATSVATKRSVVVVKRETAARSTSGT